MSTTDMHGAIVKEITINATPERVFAAIADPAQRVKWWGAQGRFQAQEMDSDLRTGGAWEMRGTAMGGRQFVIRGEYMRVEEPRVLEFTWVADWDDGRQSLVRFELEAIDGRTRVRLTHSGLAAEKARERYQGWPWLLSLLRDYAEQPAASEGGR